ncbi:helix-turn-helix domain-containing protein [Oceanobacillus chungangensis]|uniref:helix-turn-helix domain-containing protein n=1 Tax=Oceanobacillus chungangensis TaxID=1229152 RepID=UPI001472D605
MLGFLKKRSYLSKKGLHQLLRTSYLQNTLNYWLKRINDITGIHLRDPNQKVSLFIDLQLEKLKKKSL